MKMNSQGWYLSRDFHPFVKLAYASIYHYTLEGIRLHLKDAPPELLGELAGVSDQLAERSACFVSLKKHGHLRGCIGTIEALASNLAEEIIENAISAATRDPRFPPVEEEELADLGISVDVLSLSLPAKAEELDPKNLGVIVQQGGHRGLLLPDLEGVDDAKTQLRIAAEKGGIDLRQPHEIFTFTVRRYH
jgi:AmmeMemoRadiSam system protein A